MKGAKYSSDGAAMKMTKKKTEAEQQEDWRVMLEVHEGVSQSDSPKNQASYAPGTWAAQPQTAGMAGTAALAALYLAWPWAPPVSDSFCLPRIHSLAMSASFHQLIRCFSKRRRCPVSCARDAAWLAIRAGYVCATQGSPCVRRVKRAPLLALVLSILSRALSFILS